MMDRPKVPTAEVAAFLIKVRCAVDNQKVDLNTNKPKNVAFQMSHRETATASQIKTWIKDNLTTDHYCYGPDVNYGNRGSDEYVWVFIVLNPETPFEMEEDLYIKLREYGKRRIMIDSFHGQGEN
jgi:hypothetical protein